MGFTNLRGPLCYVGNFGSNVQPAPNQNPLYAILVGKSNSVSENLYLWLFMNKIINCRMWLK